MTPTQATVHVLNPALCSRSCQFRGRTKAHHDRLLRVDRDSGEVLNLIELAVTWGELEYADRGVIPPSRWLEFAQAHRWQDADQAERILALATDVAMGSMRVARDRSASATALAR